MRERLAGAWSRLRATAARAAGWGPIRGVRSHPLLSAAAVLVVTVAAAWLWAGTCGFAGCPSDAELRAFRPSEGGQVLDRRGALLGHLQTVRRINVPLARVPKNVRLAFIAVEDRRFYQHHGIDWRGTARALWRNVSHAELREGSSTLTMQAARSAFLSEYEGERSLRRKLIEVSLARRLERTLTKPQILELYLNAIYLGDGTYGVEAASRHYFGKSVSRLTLAEAALLAGLPRAPSVYDPRRHPDRSRERRDLVLALMVQERFIPEQAAERAREVPIEVADDGWTPDDVPSDALDMVRAAVDSLVGAVAWRRGELVVHTTFDLRAQRAAERAVRDRAAAIGRGLGEAEGEVQGAMAAIDPVTGELRALVGSAIYRPHGFNRAVLARRQPGSAFKPFVYAAALEAGLTPASLVDDEPVEVTEGGRVWQPANFGGEHLGTITLREALARSLNTAAVQVSQHVGVPRVVDVARRAGITSPLRPVPSIALGSFEVTPLELVAAYAPFANSGSRVVPTFLIDVQMRDKRVLWHGTRPAPRRALDPRDAFLLTSMLQSVVDEGTGHAVRDLGVTVPMAGKTGTTNDGNDVWFVGYTPTLVAGFWFGRDVPASLGGGASGGRLAAPAWASFYRNGWRDGRDDAGWTPPDGIVEARIDAETGLLANEWCPVMRREWFREGTEPHAVCASHGGGAYGGFEAFEGVATDLRREIRRALRTVFGREIARRHSHHHDEDDDDEESSGPGGN